MTCRSYLYSQGCDFVQGVVGEFFVPQRGKQLLEEFGLTDCYPLPVLLARRDNISATGPDNISVDTTYYRSIVGKLLYITNTHLNIVFSVEILSRFSHNPCERHLALAKKVCKYLCETINFSFTYTHADSLKLSGYIDSDWASDMESRCSTTRYIYYINNTPLC